MIVYLLLAGTAFAGVNRCPIQYPYAYRPIEGYDYCCKTDTDHDNVRWVDGGHVNNCYGNHFTLCPGGKDCYNHDTVVDSNICPNGYIMETAWGLAQTGDICRRIEGHEDAGTINYFCPHGCVFAPNRKAPWCVLASTAQYGQKQTAGSQDVCRIESSDWANKHTSPQQDRVAIIFNNKWEHTKLKTGGHNGLIQYSPKFNLDASFLWKFEKGEIEGTWMLKGMFTDNGHQERLRCANDGNLRTVYDAELNARDQWYVRPVTTPGMGGYYTFENAGLPGYFISLYSKTGGGCQPPKQNCIQYQDAGHNTKCDAAFPDNGFGEWSGDCDSDKDCWGPMTCDGYCYDIYDWWNTWTADCCIYENGGGAAFSHAFRLQDLFATDSAWSTVSIIENNTPDTVQHTYTLQYGVSSSYTKSTSFTLSLGKSATFGISAEADGIGASAEQSKSIGMEWTKAESETSESSVMQKWQDSFPLLPGQCKKILTITMIADDACNNVPWSFYSKIARIEMCSKDDHPDCSISASDDCSGTESHYPDGTSAQEARLPRKPRRWEVPLLGQGEGVCYEVSDCKAGLECSLDYCGKGYGAFDKCCGSTTPTAGFSAQSGSASAPKLHSIDQEYHLKESNTEAVMDKEESWLKNERVEHSAQAMTVTNAESPSLVVEGFAALGLCATLYGAYRHYFQK